jgi:hypothetical protein
VGRIRRKERVSKIKSIPAPPFSKIFFPKVPAWLPQIIAGNNSDLHW